MATLLKRCPWRAEQAKASDRHLHPTTADDLPLQLQSQHLRQEAQALFSECQAQIARAASNCVDMHFETQQDILATLDSAVRSVEQEWKHRGHTIGTGSHVLLNPSYLNIFDCNHRQPKVTLEHLQLPATSYLTRPPSNFSGAPGQGFSTDHRVGPHCPFATGMDGYGEY